MTDGVNGKLTIEYKQFKDKTHYFKFKEFPEVHGWDRNKKKALKLLFVCMSGYLEAFPYKTKEVLNQ